MALLKSIALGESGVTLTYHKIIRTNSSHLDSDKTEVILACFKDQSTRMAATSLDKSILNTFTFIFDGEKSRSDCYVALKELDFSEDGGINWKTATDC